MTSKQFFCYLVSGSIQGTKKLNCNPLLVLVIVLLLVLSVLGKLQVQDTQIYKKNYNHTFFDLTSKQFFCCLVSGSRQGTKKLNCSPLLVLVLLLVLSVLGGKVL